MTWRPEQVHYNGGQLPPDMSERITPMSASAWCNINDTETNAPKQVGHSFNADDPDREHFTKTRTVNVETGNSYGRATYQERQEVTESLDMCGYHSRKQAGLFQQSSETTAIESSAESDSIAVVEAEAEQSEAEMWKAKYEAEKASKTIYVGNS